jgi:hypothetical protein
MGYLEAGGHQILAVEGMDVVVSGQAGERLELLGADTEPFISSI